MAHSQQRPSAIVGILQRDNYTFVIEWLDGRKDDFRLSALQRACPCARCKVGEVAVDEEVRAVRIASVGRYALRIQFSSGCNSGIYDYALLREMGNGGVQ